MLTKNEGRIIFISSESGDQYTRRNDTLWYDKNCRQLCYQRGYDRTYDQRAPMSLVNSVLPGPTKSEGVGGFLDDLTKAQQQSADEVEASFSKQPVLLPSYNVLLHLDGNIQPCNICCQSHFLRLLMGQRMRNRRGHC